MDYSVPLQEESEGGSLVAGKRTGYSATVLRCRDILISLPFQVFILASKTCVPPGDYALDPS